MPAPPPVTRARWPSSDSLTARSSVSGADLMPEITDEPLCTTGPATSRRRHRCGDALEHHGQLEAGQRGTEAEVRAVAEGHVVVRRAAHVEGAGGRAELGLVAVGGRVDQEQRVTGGDRRAAELGVGDRGAHERRHRRGPAQHLLDGGREQRRVGGQPVELLGVLGQRDQRARDGVAGGLVAGHEQLDEEHAELVVGERLAVLLVGGEHRHDVVARLLPPRRGQAEQLDGHLAEQRVALVLGPVGGAGDGRLRPAEQPLLVARRQARAAGR